MTMNMSPGQKVLVAAPSTLKGLMKKGVLAGHDKILYLMDDEVELKRSAKVLDAFTNTGLRIERLVTLHPGIHDAFLITRNDN